MVAIYSSIENYYADKTIFITGATGFLGKVLIEKLLRSCPEIKKIYVLVRHKKNKTPHQRITELLDSELFSVVQKLDPHYKNKLEVIEGDLTLPSLGISAEDEQKLTKNVNIVFNSAATVKFDETLKLATDINVVGTKKVIDLCKKMKKLEALVHVSTAYANCDRKKVDEIIYTPPIEPKQLIEFTSGEKERSCSSKEINFIYKSHHNHNTYTFTKAVAETLVSQECLGHVPCAIVRPSIVGAAYKEPTPGYLANYKGATGLFTAIGTGALRAVCGKRENVCDLIPVEYPVNLMIVAAWDLGRRRLIEEEKEEEDEVNNSWRREIKVYNSATGQINGLTCGMIEILVRDSLEKYPFEKSFLPPAAQFTSYSFVRMAERLSKTIDSLEPFISNQWEFSSHNVCKIQKEMNETDRYIFSIDVKEIDWREYFESYFMGIKKYLLKENVDYCDKSSHITINRLACFKNMTYLFFANFILFISTYLVFSLF